MSHYSLTPNHCRVDFWKKSGKWYDTVCVVFRNKDYGACIHESLSRALYASQPNNYIGMTATCLEPYNENTHPISVVWQGADAMKKAGRAPK